MAAFSRNLLKKTFRCLLCSHFIRGTKFKVERKNVLFGEREVLFKKFETKQKTELYVTRKRGKERK